MPGLDLVMSLGGDGTMLYTVQLVYPAPVPILGVNAGQLGLPQRDRARRARTRLPRLVAGEFAVSERMVLEVDVEPPAPACGA